MALYVVLYTIAEPTCFQKAPLLPQATFCLLFPPVSVLPFCISLYIYIYTCDACVCLAEQRFDCSPDYTSMVESGRALFRQLGSAITSEKRARTEGYIVSMVTAMRKKNAIPPSNLILYAMGPIFLKREIEQSMCRFYLCRFEILIIHSVVVFHPWPIAFFLYSYSF